MYKQVRITSDYLENMNACPEGIKWFNEHFPDGLTISNSQEEMLDLILELEEKDLLKNGSLVWFIQLDSFHNKYIGHYPYGSSYNNSELPHHRMEIHCDDYPTLAVLISDHFLLK